jgi:hypothetical protein
MPAGERHGEAAISVLLEPVQPIPVASCYSPARSHTSYQV